MLERFDAYMERCLYDPEHGFYATGAGSAGRRGGDFITSPEVGPLFADVLVRAIERWWEELGRPASLVVHDVGSGPGTLARALERAATGSPAIGVVRAVDRVGTDGVTTAPLPTDLRGSVVIANELLDNCPIRIVERTVDGWAEVWVRTEPAAGGSRAIEELRPLDERPPVLPAEVDALAPGVRLPVAEQAARWVADMLERRPAVLLTLDYGAATTGDLAARGGWLRTYRRHERGDDPYRDPGRWDITCDVPVDQLPRPDEVIEQAEFLRRAGIDELVADGRRYWQANAATPDVHAFRMRSRVTEAEALLDPSALGSWLVCRWAEFGVPARN